MESHSFEDDNFFFDSFDDSLSFKESDTGSPSAVYFTNDILL
jgi:hypothetical protein